MTRAFGPLGLAVVAAFLAWSSDAASALAQAPGGIPASGEASPRARRSAVVTALRGTVEVEDGGAWRPVRLFDRVAGTTRVRAAAADAAGAELSLADGTTVRLSPGAVFALDPARGGLVGNVEIRMATSGPVPGMTGVTASAGAELGVVEGTRVIVRAGSVVGAANVLVLPAPESADLPFTAPPTPLGPNATGAASTAPAGRPDDASPASPPAPSGNRPAAASPAGAVPEAPSLSGPEGPAAVGPELPPAPAGLPPDILAPPGAAAERAGDLDVELD